MTAEYASSELPPRGRAGPGRGWRARAACRGVDPELFFPAAERGPVRAVQVAAAKAVCAGCPVRTECLAEALARIPYGIAGGLTENERRRLRTHDSHVRQAPGRDELPAEAAEALADGPGRGWTARQRAAVGRVLLAAGCPTPQVAQACGVTERTVHRWAAHRCAATTSTDRYDATTGDTSRTAPTAVRARRAGLDAGEGSAAATGLPSRSSRHITTGQAHEHRKDIETR
jgi:Transcription factor WhiB